MRKWILIIITPLFVTFSGITEKETVVRTEIYQLEFAHENVKAYNDLHLNIIDPIVGKFGGIFISSLYRCDKKSQHYKLQAIDLDFDLVDSASNRDVFEFIRDSLAFDQLIVYYRGSHMSHVHVSFVEGANRCEVLRCYRWKGRSWYKRLN